MRKIREPGLERNKNSFVYVGEGHGRRYGKLCEDERGFYVEHYTKNVLRRIRTGDVIEIRNPFVPKQLNFYQVEV